MSILCVGQIVFDILVRPVNNRILDLDSTLVDIISFSNGGDALNVAMICDKLGGSVGFSGKIGNDEKGNLLLGKISSSGLNIDGLKVDETSSTSSVVVLIHENGGRNFLYEGGGNNEFSINDIRLSILDNYNIVFVGGTFMLPLFDGEGAAILFKEAKKQGKITAMDVSYDATGQWIKKIEPCLKYLDYFMPSIGEAKEMSGFDNVEEMALEFLNRGVKHVIIKMGKDGIYIKDNQVNTYLPSFKVDVIDTTGAGDSFVAGFLTGIDHEMKLLDCVELGQAVAAHCIQSIGSTTGIVDFDKTRRSIETMEKINE